MTMTTWHRENGYIRFRVKGPASDPYIMTVA